MKFRLYRLRNGGIVYYEDGDEYSRKKLEALDKGDDIKSIFGQLFKK